MPALFAFICDICFGVAEPNNGLPKASNEITVVGRDDGCVSGDSLLLLLLLLLLLDDVLGGGGYDDGLFVVVVAHDVV